MRVWAWWLRRLAMLLAGFLGAAGPALAQAPASVAMPAPSGPNPAIWLVEDGDTRIFLFGTVHLFPSSVEWRSPALDRIIASADELVMETPDASAEDMSGGERMLAPMRLGKSVPIMGRVSPEARLALAAAIEASGVPAEFYDELATWGVAFLLTGTQIAQAHQSADGQALPMSGAETVLAQAFRKRRRPILGVETVEDQLRVFSTMPFSAQRAFLESTVTGTTFGSAPPPTPEQMANALNQRDWTSGDVEAIAAEMQTMPPIMYDRLLTVRNRAWTGWLTERLQRPGTVLFAVGAGHLAGPDSVQAMLAARGVTARRVH